MILNLIGISGIFGFVIFIIYRFRSDGISSERLKNQQAINDQNDELLEYLKKQKDFIYRISTDPVDAERMRKIVNNDIEK